jgi:hypothetical protein
MYVLTKTKLECTDFVVYMAISAVKDYLGLALSAKDMPAVNSCVSMDFVRDALGLVKSWRGASAMADKVRKVVESMLAKLEGESVGGVYAWFSGMPHILVRHEADR